jgi:hypothetical protein
MNLTKVECDNRFAIFTSYENNWDLEDKERPNEYSLNSGKEIVEWAFEHNIGIVDIGVTDVDTDVVGGLAIYFGWNIDDIWILCSNSGNTTVTIPNGHMFITGPFKDLKEEIIRVKEGFYDKI